MTETNNASPGSDLTFLQKTPSPTVSLSGFPGVDDHYTVSPVSPSVEAINNNMSSLELWRESIVGNKIPDFEPSSQHTQQSQGNENKAPCLDLVHYRPPVIHWPTADECAAYFAQLKNSKDASPDVAQSLPQPRIKHDLRRKERAQQAAQDPRRGAQPTLDERLQKTKELAHEIGEHCRIIASTPSTLVWSLLNMPTTRRKTFVRALRQLDPKNENMTPLKPIADVVTFCFREYGVDYYCGFEDGSDGWVRDIDVIYTPRAADKIYKYWTSSAHYLTTEDVRNLGSLPQYMYAEGDRLLRAMESSANVSTYD